MKVTLIYPSVGRKAGKPYVRAWQMQPLSMAVLAGLMPPDVEVTFYDDRLEPIPFDEPTDLVVLSVETFTALRSYWIAAEFRARGVPVVMGGYHVTLFPDEAAEQRTRSSSATPSRSGRSSLTMRRHRACAASTTAAANA